MAYADRKLVVAIATVLFAGGVGACRERVPQATAPLDESPLAPPPAAALALEAGGVAQVDAGAPAPAQASDAMPPLEAESWVVRLAVPGFEDAMVAVPLGTRGPRPLIVALHGNFDRPEWACGSWRSVAGPEPFILCPRGMRRPDSPAGEARFTYVGAAAAERELEAGVAALRARFGERVAAGPSIYAGFSLGAILGISIVTKAPRTYSRIVFVEGGHDGWSADVARRFARGGGQRALFVCAQPGCQSGAKRAAKALEAAGVSTKVVYAGNHGHAYDGPVADATRGEWNWLTEEGRTP